MSIDSLVIKFVSNKRKITNVANIDPIKTPINPTSNPINVKININEFFFEPSNSKVPISFFF